MQHQTKKCQCVACGGKSIPACYRSRQLAASAQARLRKEGCGGDEEYVNSEPSVEHVPKVAKKSVDKKDQLIEKLESELVVEQSVYDKKDHQIMRLCAKIEKLESELFESQNQKIALMIGFGIFAVSTGMSIYLKK
jgi:uncharacterized coiled-coil protein SlyX